MTSCQKLETKFESRFCSFQQLKFNIKYSHNKALHPQLFCFDEVLTKMRSLFRSGRSSRLGGLPGFQPASNLLQNARLRQQHVFKKSKIQHSHKLNLKRFQLYNKVSKTWAIQINQSPILLSINDIKEWLSFRTDKLKMNQLYLWHATQFDWIPLWSTKNGFLLMDLNMLNYDNTNYNQLTLASWVKANSVSPESVKILLQRFNIPSDTIKTMVPVINTHIEDGRQIASGQAFFVDYYDRSNEQIPFFEEKRFNWTNDRFYDKENKRYNYQFLREYKKTWYFNNKAQHSNQVKTFAEAINKSENGAYIYNEKDQYIPFSVNNGIVTFNCGEAIDNKHIRQQLNQNRIITTNSHNKLARRDYELLWPNRHSLFIDQVSDNFRTS